MSENYNSRGVSVHLEAEITAPIQDSDAVIEQVKEIFDLAEEALDQQIERTRSTDALASHDGQNHSGGTTQRSNFPGTQNGYPSSPQRENYSHGNGQPPPANARNAPPHEQREEPATNKQIQYLLSIAKRQRRSTSQMEQEVQHILQQQVGIYDLTKRQAAQAIDVLTKVPETTRSTSRF